MTDVEKKVFVNWPDSGFEQGSRVVLVSNRRDLEALRDRVPLPFVCLPWNGPGAAWLRPYVRKGWFKNVMHFYMVGGADEAELPQTEMICSLLGYERCMVCFWKGYNSAADAVAAQDEEANARLLCGAETRFYVPKGVVPVTALMPALEERRTGQTPDRGLEVHWGEQFDKICRFNMGSVAIVVGREGEGKSSWVDELTMRLALIHDLKVSVWTPEAKYMETHVDRLTRLLYQREFISNMPDDDFWKAMDFINSHYVYIDFPFPDDYEDLTDEEKRRHQPTLKRLMRKAHYNARVFGTRVFVFDPLLLIQKDDPRQHDFYFYRDIIDESKNLAEKSNGLVILVTHPHRLNATDLQRSDRPVTGQDIYGSALFAFMLDYVFAINRYDKSDGRQTPYVSVEICKVKQQQYGTRGMTYFTFQPRGERFNPTTMRDVETKNGKGTTHIEPVQTYINPKRWLDKEGRPDLAALEFLLPVNMVNGERLKVNDSNVNHAPLPVDHAPGSARRTPLRGENPEPVNHEPSKVNRQLLMDSLLDDAAQNQNPALPD